MRSKTSETSYPRIDKEYQSKSSLDFQTMRSNIYQTRPSNILVKLYSWIAFLILGVFVGVSAFIIDLLVENLLVWKWQITEIVFNFSVALGWMTFIVFSLLFGGTAAIMTVFLGPGAAGGGTVELMGYLNGINYPSFIGIKTLIVKIFGLGLAVSSGLCIGKEGPLAHIGAILGHCVIYLPFSFLSYFRNDCDKREMAAAGAAAGVAAAFGSPIGGSLFAFEISRPSTFWSFGLTWKIFFCSSISTFILNILSCLRQGKDVSIVNAGLIKFGQYDENPYKLHDFPFFILLGVMGGLLGALFIFINYTINRYRKLYLLTKWQKVIEATTLVLITSTIIYYAPMILRNNCLQEDDKTIEASFIKYKCDDDEFNPLATFLLIPEGTVIKAFLSKNAKFDYEPLFLFFIIWYIFTAITYGTSVPAGLFLPGIMIGCSMGRMVGLFIENHIIKEIRPSTYAIIGAASILAGYTRLSFSLAVIMLETTENVGLFLPIIFALFVSFGIGRIFNRSLYNGTINFKNIPFLVEHVPACNQNLTASGIMSQPVYTMQPITQVHTVLSGLSDHDFNGFPIVDSNGRLCGLVTRQILYVLLKKKCWCEKSEFVRKDSGTSSQGDLKSITDSSRTGESSRVEEETGAEHDSKSQKSNSAEKISSEFKKKDKRYHYLDDEQTEQSQVDIEPPLYHHNLTWKDFNTNFHSKVPELSEDLKKLCTQNLEKEIDLRPFMIETPFFVQQSYKFQQIVELFRTMNLRHLPVVREEDNKVVGIITRQDIFAFMTL